MISERNMIWTKPPGNYGTQPLIFRGVMWQDSMLVTFGMYIHTWSLFLSSSLVILPFCPKTPSLFRITHILPTTSNNSSQRNSCLNIFVTTDIQYGTVKIEFIIYLTHPEIFQPQSRGFDRSQRLGRVLRRSRNASRWPPYARIGWRMCCGATSVPWKWWKWDHQNINHQR